MPENRAVVIYGDGHFPIDKVVLYDTEDGCLVDAEFHGNEFSVLSEILRSLVHAPKKEQRQEIALSFIKAMNGK